MKWLLLILSLPTQNATVRMRVWRALKTAGAAVLRDGVYLLPHGQKHEELFGDLAQEVVASEGSAHVLTTDTEDSNEFVGLFDRREDYTALLNELAQLQIQLQVISLQEFTKQLRKVRKSFTTIAAIDFFPGGDQIQAQFLLQSLELQLNRQLSPGEPHESAGEIRRLDISLYQKRVWATRKRPWVDRLASAWLIRRFIDKDAQLMWLESPDDCPEHALGFDFDGARFTHLNGRVTFEVLLESFGLDQPGLQRLGALVHYLDMGGIQASEASGLEQILWGLRNTIHNDDQLLTAAQGVFDALLTAFADKNYHEHK